MDNVNTRMQRLNLPPFEIKIREKEGKYSIFDPHRRRWVALTPEEWVRQHFTNYLVVEKGYPSGRIANEFAITLNGMERRCDTVIFDNRMQPLMIVEYKAPTVNITQKVFQQVLNYCIVLQPRWIVVSNGLQHYCCQLSGDQARFVEEIPFHKEII